MTPGERMKAARKRLNYSVEQMADALHLRGENAGVDVRNWERGRREPTGVVVRCAEALAIVADLLDVMRESTNDQRPAVERANAFLGADE